MALSNTSDIVPFSLAKFIWKPKVPSKVKVFSSLIEHKKVNTNDMLQLRKPFKSLSLNWYVLCEGSGESIDHLFLYCPITLGFWHSLSRQVKIDWVLPKSICDLLIISYKDWEAPLKVRPFGKFLVSHALDCVVRWKC